MKCQTERVWLVFTLPVRDLGDTIIQRFWRFHPFIFIVIHRNTIHGGWGRNTVKTPPNHNATPKRHSITPPHVVIYI